mmetsp:Transcript_140001/g.435429  ORF Transcript_140001/g.435429 Transcript_140001/m.435429 type:complete len:230 (-) Transcript_140001:631-1320(-)
MIFWRASACSFATFSVMARESCSWAPTRLRDSSSQRQRRAASSSSAQSFSWTPVLRQSGASIAGGGPSARRPRHCMLREVRLPRARPSRTRASRRRTRPTAAGHAPSRAPPASPKRCLCTPPCAPRRPRKRPGRLCRSNALLTSKRRRPGGEHLRWSARSAASSRPLPSSSSSSNPKRAAKRKARNNLTGSSLMDARAPRECGTRTMPSRRSARPLELGSRTLPVAVSQ